MSLLGLALVFSLSRPAAAEPSLEEKAGQLFMVAIDTEIAARYESYIRSGRLGGAILRWDRFSGAEARAFSQRMQEWASSSPSRIPFWVGTDHEGGPFFTQRLFGGAPFPGNMALGAAGSESLAEEAAYALGLELRALGIHVTFAPVLDVQTNPDNPIIGVRSFGEDPGQVSRLGLASLRGYRRSGILPVVKHFPGHGEASVDSHLELPVVAKSLEALRGSHLLPFRAAIEAGAPALMPAHIVFPALGTGSLPVTLSSPALQGFLRKEMGFGGAVFSDSLDMGAIAGRYGAGEAAILALLAGNDVLLAGKADFPQVYEAVLAAVRGGRIPRERLEEAAGRVLSLKRLGLLGAGRRALPFKTLGRRRHRRLARRIAELSVTLARNEGALIPLRPPKESTLCVVVMRSPRFEEEARLLVSEIRRRHLRTESVELLHVPERASAAEALERARRADFLVVGTFAFGTGDFKDQVSLVREILALGKPTVLISFMNPYDLRHFPGARAALCTYGLTRSALEAAVRVLFGERKPRGRLPVTIPGFAKAGEGL